jgi:hypothetical protein
MVGIMVEFKSTTSRIPGKSTSHSTACSVIAVVRLIIHIRRFASWLTCKPPGFAGCDRTLTPLEFYRIYVSNKEMYCILTTCCIISVLFSTKFRLFNNFIFFYSNKTHVFHKPCAVIEIPTPSFKGQGSVPQSRAERRGAADSRVRG